MGERVLFSPGHSAISRAIQKFDPLYNKCFSMSPQSRQLAGILLIVLPTVIYGGVSLLSFLINDPRYMQNPLRQNLFRAGHAHAGVLLVLSLIVLRYIDEANLSNGWKAI